MERTRITRDVLASALRHLRTSGRLTQKRLSKRAALFEDLGFGRLLESQISDFERGRTLPSLGSLLNLLAGCSEDGNQVDFGAFQRALELITDHGDAAEVRSLENPVAEPPDMVDRIADELLDRWVGPLQGAMSHQRDELAELRVRLVRTERLMALLLNGEGGEGHGSKHTAP